MHGVSTMKPKRICVRLSQKRYDKFKGYADSKEKEMTQLIEDWIDRLPNIGE
jgi:hypothetical protein